MRPPPSRLETLRAIEELRVLAVVRLDDATRLQPIIEALAAGDVRAIEVTVTTPGAIDAMAAMKKNKIVRIAIVAFALVVAYPYIPGSESAAFKGVSLFIGILFSLGSSTKKVWTTCS